MQEYLPVRDMKVNDSLELHPGMKIEEIKPHIEDLYKFMEKSNEKYKGQFISQDWVAAYATIFARCAIDEVGLFDPLYQTGTEDLDLMNRLGKYGYRTGQALDSFVFHFGGVSRGSYQREDREIYDKQDKENHVKYKNKWDKRKVVIFTGPAWEPWNKQKVDEGMAGSETWAAYLAPEFVKLGFKTIIYNDLLIDNKKSSLLDPVFNNNGEMIGNVIYRDYTNIESDMEYNVIDYFITSRTVDPLRKKIHALRSYVMVHDIWLSADKNYDIMSWHVEKYAYLSEWHKQFLISHHHIPESKMALTANGQDMRLYEDVDSYEKKNQSVYSSSPDRGLYQLLKMLPLIRKEVPDFELVVAYGFFNWESMAKKRNDTASMELIEKIKKLLEQPGVKYVDRISKRELAHYEKESKVWLFPEWFDETFCCLPGTLITTDSLTKNIEDIIEGTNVLTHTGNLKPVTHVFKREIDEEINIIKVKYIKEILKITGNHDLLILSKNSNSLHCVRMQHTPCTKRALKCATNFKYCGSYKAKKSCWKLNEKYETKWIPADSVEKGDYVLYPKNKKENNPGKLSEYCADPLVDGRIISIFCSKTKKHLDKSSNQDDIGISCAHKIKDFTITEDFLLFCGWYISEGCYNDGSAISFSLNINKKEIGDFLFKQGELLGLNPWKEVLEDINTLKISMSSAIIGRFLIDNFGKGAKNKRIPQWVKDLAPNFLLKVLEGLLNGDGCYSEDRNVIGLECASKQLILDLFDIFLKFNCVSSLGHALKPKVIKEKKDGKYILKRGERELEAYSIRCSMSQNVSFFNSIGYNAVEKRSTGQAALQDDNYVYLPVVYNKKERYKGFVYNLEVEEDNTYVANNLIVHNCISAVSAGLAKNAIICTDKAGLKTTVGNAGVMLPPTGLYRDMEYPSIYIEKFVKEAVKMLKDEEYRKSWADKAYVKMKEYTWKNVAMGWIKMFDIKDT